MSAAKKTTISDLNLQNLLKGGWAGSVKVSNDVGGELPQNMNSLVWATEKQSPSAILKLALDHGARQICQVDAGFIEKEVQSSAAMLFRPALFLSCPVSLILDPKRSSIIRENELTKLNLQFARATEKAGTLNRIGDYLRSQGKSQSLVSEVTLVADEMFTNAIFNAPFVDMATGKNPDLDRTNTSVAMGKDQRAELLIGHDEDRLVIACRDPFGSLEPKKLLQRIRDCWNEGVSANMKMGSGGAGIGSFMVFNSCSSYYVGVEKHGMTVVAVTIHWKWSSRKRMGATKNLHWFAN